MKKALLVVLLLALALFCLIVTAVGGFFGYRYYKKHRPPPAVESAEHPSEGEAEAPSADATPEEEVRPEAAEEPAEPAPTPRPASPPSAPARPPAQSRPSSPPRQPVREPSPPQPAPEVPAYPQPYPSAPSPAEPYQPTRPQTQKGSLGIIFESELEDGEVVIKVDGEPVERRTFSGSDDNRFRLTKTIRLSAGAHRLRVAVVLPGGHRIMKEWDVGVTPGGNTVWKAELNDPSDEMTVKHIQ